MRDGQYAVRDGQYAVRDCQYAVRMVNITCEIANITCEKLELLRQDIKNLVREKVGGAHVRVHPSLYAPKYHASHGQSTERVMFKWLLEFFFWFVLGMLVALCIVYAKVVRAF